MKHVTSTTTYKDQYVLNCSCTPTGTLFIGTEDGCRRNMVRHLDEAKLISAVEGLVNAGRTANASQIMTKTGFSRAKVRQLTWDLELRGVLKDAGKGQAYHWRVTS